MVAELAWGKMRRGRLPGLDQKEYCVTKNHHRVDKVILSAVALVVAEEHGQKAGAKRQRG